MQVLNRRGHRCLDTRLSQYYIGSKMTFCHLSNFCRKKFLGLTKSNGFAKWFSQITTPKIIQKCTETFFSKPGNCFCRKLKNDRMSFLDHCNVGTASRLGFSCSKVARFKGGLFQKLFKGYIFFHGNSFGWKTFELFARETNLEKKRSV